MNLRNLDLACEYRSDGVSLVDDFYIPCLKESSHYWRAVGYFTSAGLALAARGLADFIEHTGTMRLVAGPRLDRDDVDALEKGHQARNDVVERALLREFEIEPASGIPDLVRYRLECLAWLVAEERLEIKIAVPSDPAMVNARGIYHEKIGIFGDDGGNSVAFTGSPNETAGGLINNFESIDVFWSWDDPHARVDRKRRNFVRLWENSTPRLEVIDFPRAAREKLLEWYAGAPPDVDPESSRQPLSLRICSVPGKLRLRDYQLEAIDKWFENGCRGFLEMATGTGKTITALAAACRLAERGKRLALVISAPFQHLVDQWRGDAVRFGFAPTLAYESRSTWWDRLTADIALFGSGHLPCVSVITTHATLTGEAFQSAIADIKGPALIIADEAHHLGAERSRTCFPLNFDFRLALSATPDRWFDDQGTQLLRQYFGSTVYEFPLARAIQDDWLTPYYYRPILVPLTDEEMDAYRDLSAKIARCMGATDEQSQEALTLLLTKRANLLNTAQGKLPILSGVLDRHPCDGHALFYCAPDQISDTLFMLGHEKGLLVHRFTAEEGPDERQRLLREFSDGALNALVAMRCLDEGVDVPSTRTAYILASSGNPREFIQRRGRILRKSAGKEHAVIYDLVAVPPQSYHPDPASEVFASERSVVRRELQRFREFADLALNKHEALDVIWDTAKRYGLTDV